LCHKELAAKRHKTHKKENLYAFYASGG